MHKTIVDIPSALFSLDHRSRIHFMGSCFAENLVDHFENAGFHICKDPYGVVFNPLSLAKNMKQILSCKIDSNAILISNGLSLSYDANSTVYGLDQEELIQQIDNGSQEFNRHLIEGSTLFITFGTAIIYELHDFGVVANCHKQNSSLFQKRMAQKKEIINAWSPLLAELEKRKVNVVFTISPVRHKKEGIVQSTWSKAILLDAVHELCKESNAFYFPAYEIVLDELRDYAYFKKDGVHPNEIAVEYVWQRVRTAFLSLKTNEFIDQFQSLLKLFKHRPIHPRSIQAIEFNDKRNEKLADFKSKHPNINYSCFESI
jgi:hypothetical protein